MIESEKNTFESKTLYSDLNEDLLSKINSNSNFSFLANLNPLPAHPSPNTDLPLSKWIEDLAEKNNIKFLTLLKYIKKKLGNFNNYSLILEKLTFKDKFQILRLKNDIIFQYNENTCPFRECNYVPKRKDHIASHLAWKHNINVQLFYCKMCDSNFKFKEKLTEHMKLAHNIKVKYIKCSECEKIFKSNGNLKQHKKFIHGIDLILTKCDICGLKFKGNHNLKLQ